MKKIVLKVVHARVRGQEETVELDYGDLFYRALMWTGSVGQGTILEAIRRRTKVLDVLEPALDAKAEHFLLEEPEHRTLVQALEPYPYGLVSHAVVEMVDAVKAAPDVEVEEVGAATD